MNTVEKLYFKHVKDIQGKEFDYIVIGGGAYGTSFAHRILQLDPKAEVLVLEKGNYLIPEHIQNLPPTYVKLNTEAGIRPWQYIGTPDLNFMPQIPYLGGRALFWNAWIPQPDETELPDWPQEAIEILRPAWYEAGCFLGRRYSLKTPGNENDALTSLMRDRLFAGLSTIATATPIGNPRGLDCAMATGQDVSSEGWAKFSPIPVLVADVQAYPERLCVVIEAEVDRLITKKHRVTKIQTTSSGSIHVGRATVLLACNTLEAGFIMARSFPENPLIGKNLSGHIRSWLALRVPINSVPALTDGLQAMALYLSGRSAQGRLLHTHISVVHNPHPDQTQDILYKILPDASTPQAVATYQDPNYVVIMLHSMGEFLGAPKAGSWNYVGVDKQGQAVVHVRIQDEDEEFWKIMDTTTYQVADVLTAGAPVEYQHEDSSWHATPPASIRNKGLVHCAGTLWMGDDARTSVTTPRGQVHGVDNLYGAGSMIFPRPGSWNPTLTGVTQMFALARYFAA